MHRGDRAVAGAIIHQNDTEVGIMLFSQGRQAIKCDLALIPVQNDDGNVRLRCK
jgi:hypothetical protein